MIRHIVFFRFTDDSDNISREEKAKEFSAIFSPLECLECVREYRVGINISVSENAWDVVIDSTFNSIEDLRNYSDSPEHKEAIRLGKKFSKEKSVVDYKI